jgi:hypothetical protein
MGITFGDDSHTGNLAVGKEEEASGVDTTGKERSDG